MSTFQFDTSGEVRGRRLLEQPDGNWRSHWRWEDLPSDFVRGYFTAIARSYWESLDQNQKDRLDHFGPIAFSDFSPELVGRGMADCASFENVATGLGVKKLGETEGGYFWVGRNNGTLQHAWAAAYPPLCLVIAEDGLQAEERK